MKKRIPFLLTFLFALCVAQTAFSQGEWMWVNYWTGNDDPFDSNHRLNHVVSTAFDDDGNVYVYGSIGGNARLYDQTSSTWFSDIAPVVAANTQGCVLVKFDSLGNYLWSRMVKKSKQGECQPYDMVLHGNRIYIAGQYYFDHSMNENLWFLDTLVTQQTALSYLATGECHPPYSLGHYSFFSVLDLDGNVLESHFVKTLTRELHNGMPGELTLFDSMNCGCPICIDSQGNIYLAVHNSYGGVDTMPFTVVIDEDPSRTYPLYLPGNCDSIQTLINAMMLYKFSPAWELEWMKLVVDHVELEYQDGIVDTLYPFTFMYQLLEGMSVDENDNLYLSGLLENIELLMENYFDVNSLSKVRIYWDSVHYATVDDRGLAWNLPFVIKYDSDGDILWSNQAYMKESPSTGATNSIEWTDNTYYNNSVYLAGMFQILPNLDGFCYFDNENNAVNGSEHTTLFVRFNSQNGHCESFGVVPGGTVTSLGDPATPAVINNHLAFLPMQRLYPDKNYLLAHFNIDGTFERADTIYMTNNTATREQRVLFNDDGRILCDFVCNQDPAFGQDISLYFDDHQRSHAMVACRYDPSILIPYPVDSTGVAQHEAPSPVRIYPNPTGGLLHIENGEAPVERIAVSDLSGRELLARPVSGNRCEVDVSALSDGMYVVKVECAGKTYTGKFVKGRY